MTAKNDQQYQQAYRRGKDFLLGLLRPSTPDPEGVLAHYLEFPDTSATSTSLEKVFERMLVSAQNANMKAGVIGGSIGGMDNLGPVVCGFHPGRVAETYGDDWESLLSAVETQLKPNGKMRKTTQSIWPKYCKTVVSAARFFSQFKTGAEFYDWARHFYDDKKSMAALPLILSEEIYGIGYALACDFLKELGFTNYGKPDVHIIDLFTGLGLCDKSASPYEIQKVIVAMANANNVSAYNVDKLFWLIGSGKFYNHPNIGNDGGVGRNKQRFLDEVAAEGRSQ